MCTLTVLSFPEGSVITMNRDERRDRHEPGILHRQHSSIYPLDERSQGTWFGLNRNGVVLALLNRYQQEHAGNRRSRGELIPQALQQASPADWLSALDPSPWNPFDLFCVDGQQVRHFQWNGEGEEYLDRTVSIDKGFMFTSSSYFTDEVLAWREERFRHWLGSAGEGEPLQTGESILADFHRYTEPGLETHTVLMNRELSHSKSICQVNSVMAPGELKYLNLEQNRWQAESLL